MITEEQKAELAKINAPGTPLRNYQLYDLGILKEFARVCEEHNLTWYAAWGTLLGAARHNGFIPWDDDIDVWMFPEDYFKFREIVTKEDALGDDYYFQCHSENPANFIFWQRIGVKNSTSLPKKYKDIPGDWGVCIDIFPLGDAPSLSDSAGVDAYEQALKEWKQISNKYMYKHDAANLSGLKKAYHLLRAAGSDEDNIKKWLQAEQKVLTGAGHADAEFVRDPADKFTFRRELFGTPVYLPFEDTQLPVPQYYEEVLITMYGEKWSDLPPDELRVWHGGGGSEDVIVSLEKPWTDFM